jgi:catechol 2,3-dioxygenase-like lactoylglutathione lyase family enzyme
MKPKISIVSLTVSDVTRSLAFYRDGLGFPTHNHADGDAYIMFRLEGSWLSIVAREETVKDLPGGAGLTFSSVALSHNVASEEAVRAVFEQGLAAGATAIKTPQPAPWGGYEAAFADPDGHVWDIAMNPFTDLT